MSGFSADWLALREPADAAARSATLAHLAVRSLPPDHVRAVDLATGTGANVRYLAPLLPPDQEWLLVDDDEQLLHALPQRLPGLRFDARRIDLSDLSAPALVEGRALVTASALLDLVSEPWVASLAVLCARVRAVVLLALSYGGRIACWPAEPEDALVQDLVNRHQRRDKGFGQALGPDATSCAADHFACRGYRVMRESSDWVLNDDHRALQRQLIEGWAGAAAAVEPSQAAAVVAWKVRRLEHVTAGRSTLIVSHEDLLAICD
jgi:hypothetical protein